MPKLNKLRQDEARKLAKGLRSSISLPGEVSDRIRAAYARPAPILADSPSKLVINLEDHNGILKEYDYTSRVGNLHQMRTRTRGKVRSKQVSVTCTCRKPKGKCVCRVEITGLARLRALPVQQLKGESREQAETRALAHAIEIADLALKSGRLDTFKHLARFLNSRESSSVRLSFPVATGDVAQVYQHGDRRYAETMLIRAGKKRSPRVIGRPVKPINQVSCVLPEYEYYGKPDTAMFQRLGESELKGYTIKVVDRAQGIPASHVREYSQYMRDIERRERALEVERINALERAYSALD